MAKKLKISPLEFKYSSATVRFFGKLIPVNTHVVGAKLSRLKMICPNALIENEKPCRLCKAELGYGFADKLALVWDCRAKKWAAFSGSPLLFNQIYEKSKEAGANAALIEAGQGPDVHLQFMLGNIETEVDIGTVGVERGINPPSMAEFLTAVQKQSVWLKYDSPRSVMNDFPYPPPEIFPKPNWDAVSDLPVSGIQFVKIIEPLPEKPDENRV